jgi:hypothetical protein
MHCYSQIRDTGGGRDVPLEMRFGDGGEIRGGSWDGFGPSAEGEDAEHQQSNHKSSDQRAAQFQKLWSRLELYLELVMLEIRKRQQKLIESRQWVFVGGRGRGNGLGNVECGSREKWGRNLRGAEV